MRNVSIYIVGSAASGEACPTSDIDINIFINKNTVKPRLILKPEISLLITKYPINGLIHDPLLGKPACLPTKMFTSSPRKHVLGEKIELHLNPKCKVNTEELIQWSLVRILGGEYALDREDYRGVLKNYVKLVWATIAYEKQNPPPYTFKTLIRELRNHKSAVLSEKHIKKAIEACRKIYTCTTITREEAEKYLTLLSQLNREIIEALLKENN